MRIGIATWFIIVGGILVNSISAPHADENSGDLLHQVTASSANKNEVLVDRPLRKVLVEGGVYTVDEIFTLTNNGSQHVELQVDHASCGCVGAVLSSQSLAPGQSATLNFKMETSGRGTKVESVTLRTNNPRQPQIVLTVQAQMPLTVIANPSQLFMTMAEGKGGARALSIFLPDKAVIKRISAEHKFVTAKLISRQSSDDGVVQLFRVNIATSAPPGKFIDALIFDLNNAPVRQVKVPIEVIVEPDIAPTPDEVFLGNVGAKSVQRKIVIVQSQMAKPFRIQSVTSTDPRISGIADPDISSPSHAVEVRIQTEGEIGSVFEKVLTLVLSNGRTLKLPIVGRISNTNRAPTASAISLLEEGSRAPEFSAVDMNGDHKNLSDLKGRKNLLLTFFPKCFTGGCSGQLASLQRELSNFSRDETEVWAVSVDSAQEQIAFTAKLGLQFPLIPDTDRKLSILFGAAQDKADLAARQSILIDKTGVVRWIDTNVNVQTHGAVVLAKMRELGMAK